MHALQTSSVSELQRKLDEVSRTNSRLKQECEKLRQQALHSKELEAIVQKQKQVILDAEQTILLKVLSICSYSFEIVIYIYVK